MPATFPRIQVTFERPTYAALAKIARAEHKPLSFVVAQLVESAMTLGDDLALARLAEERLQTFRRDDALTSDALLRWNRRRHAS